MSNLVSLACAAFLLSNPVLVQGSAAQLAARAENRWFRVALVQTTASLLAVLAGSGLLRAGASQVLRVGAVMLLTEGLSVAECLLGERLFPNRGWKALVPSVLLNGAALAAVLTAMGTGQSLGQSALFCLMAGLGTGIGGFVWSAVARAADEPWLPRPMRGIPARLLLLGLAGLLLTVIQ